MKIKDIFIHIFTLLKSDRLTHYFLKLREAKIAFSGVRKPAHGLIPTASCRTYHNTYVTTQIIHARKNWKTNQIQFLHLL